MATVQNVLDSAKYDLRDYGAKEFNLGQMIHYLNRVISFLDRALIDMNSDQTVAETSITLTSGTDFEPVPTAYTVNIREIWDDSQTILYKMSAMDLYERRMHRYSQTAEPRYWSHIGNNIEFEVEADKNYDFTVYHDVTSTILTLGADDMPYNSTYDEFLRENLVLLARSRTNDKIAKTDAAYLQMFREHVHADMIQRGFIPNTRLKF